jgi:hypothetical protein
MSELQSAEVDPQHGAIPTLHDHGNAGASDRQSLEQRLEEDPNVDSETSPPHILAYGRGRCCAPGRLAHRKGADPHPERGSCL